MGDITLADQADSTRQALRAGHNQFAQAIEADLSDGVLTEAEFRDTVRDVYHPTTANAGGIDQVWTQLQTATTADAFNSVIRNPQNHYLLGGLTASMNVNTVDVRGYCYGVETPEQFQAAINNMGAVNAHLSSVEGAATCAGSDSNNFHYFIHVHQAPIQTYTVSDACFSQNGAAHTVNVNWELGPEDQLMSDVAECFSPLSGSISSEEQGDYLGGRSNIPSLSGSQDCNLSTGICHYTQTVQFQLIGLDINQSVIAEDVVRGAIETFLLTCDSAPGGGQQSDSRADSRPQILILNPDGTTNYLTPAN